MASLLYIEAPNICPNMVAAVDVNSVVGAQVYSHRITVSQFLIFMNKAITYYRKKATLDDEIVNLVLDNCSAHLKDDISTRAEQLRTIMLFVPPKSAAFILTEFQFRRPKSKFKQKPKFSNQMIIEMIESFMLENSKNLNVCHLFS